jgi:hypothetical protein
MDNDNNDDDLLTEFSGGGKSLTVEKRLQTIEINYKERVKTLEKIMYGMFAIRFNLVLPPYWTIEQYI